MKTKTHIKAGGLTNNHNETLVRTPPPRSGLKVKTHVKAGGVMNNHNETLARTTNAARRLPSTLRDGLLVSLLLLVCGLPHASAYTFPNVCPCNHNEFNAADLYAELESTDIGVVVCKYTRQNAYVDITGIDWTGEYTPFFPYMTLHAWTASDGKHHCSYSVKGNANYYPPDPPYLKNLPNITTGQLEACRKDISTLIKQLNASPFSCGFQVTW
jgi:hypothetical protein